MSTGLFTMTRGDSLTGHHYEYVMLGSLHSALALNAAHPKGSNRFGLTLTS